MKIKLKFFCFCLLISALCLPALSQGTAFTYQGRLNDGVNPANGSYDLTFSLFTVSSGGSAVAGPLALTAVGITNGLFTVVLDYGSGAFNGTTYWLEIGTRTNGAASFVTLSPRQQLTPTPYAIFGENAGTAALANSVANSTVSSSQLNTLAPPTSGQVLQFNGSSLVWANPANTFSAWSLAGNAGTTAGVNFVGTTDNQPFELRINGQRAFRLEPTITVPNVIGGYGGNVVDSGAQGATIGGGGVSGYINQISSILGTVAGGSGNIIQGNANDSTIVGGRQNQINYGDWGGFIGGGHGNSINTNSQYSTVSGGLGNTIGTNSSQSTIGGGQNNNINFNASYSVIGGGYNNNSSVTVNAGSGYTTIGGGYGNTAVSSFGYTTIGGGYLNTAGGTYATVSGGENNTASGANSTVSGGYFNSATGSDATVAGGIGNSAGTQSFAAGSLAHANSANSFVWGDSSAAFYDNGPNTFNVLATNGVYLQGIYGKSVSGTPAPVYVNSLGQLGTVGPNAFVIQANAENLIIFVTSNDYGVKIDNALCNGNPNAILIVTPNGAGSNYAYWPDGHPFFVTYWVDSHWYIISNGGTIVAGQEFNVMVANP